MKTRASLLALSAAIIVGAVTIRGHAQAPSNPPAYYISEFEVTDPKGLEPYRDRVASTFEPFGGRYIARGGRIVPLEAEAPKGRVVIIAFESMEKAQAWYDLPAYAQLKPIRHKAAKSRVFIVEGTGN